MAQIYFSPDDKQAWIDPPKLEGKPSYAIWRVEFEKAVAARGLSAYLTEINPPNYTYDDQLAVYMAILESIASTKPVISLLCRAGFSTLDPTYHNNPCKVYQLLEQVMTASVDRRADGRLALAEYQKARPYEYKDLAEFVTTLKKLYDATDVLGGSQSDTVRVWHCLNCLEQADPNWERRLVASEKSYLAGETSKNWLSDTIEWEAIRPWDTFSEELIRRGGRLQFIPPAGINKERVAEPLQEPAQVPTAGQPPAEQQQAVAKVSSEERPAEVQPNKDIRAGKSPSEEQTTKEPLLATHPGEQLEREPVVAEQRPEQAAEGKQMKPNPKTNKKKKKKKNGSANNHLGAPGAFARAAAVDGTGSTKSVRFADQENVRNDISSNGKLVDDNGLWDDEDYDDCGDYDDDGTDAGTDGGYADDVNYEDGTNGNSDDRDAKNVVHINGELRYKIPGYESRRKPRKMLLSAPPFVIKRFFRQKFPGRPRCRDCRCQHPVDGYSSCSVCHFCHMGGDAECYHQNPELGGTRPAKDKYQRLEPKPEPSTELEADTKPEPRPELQRKRRRRVVYPLVHHGYDSDDGPFWVSGSESDGNDSIVGAAANKGNLGDLTSSLSDLRFIEKDELTKEDLLKVTSASIPVSIIGTHAEQSRRIELAIRTKADEESRKKKEKAQTPTQAGQAEKRATKDNSQATKKLESKPAPALAASSSAAMEKPASLPAPSDKSEPETAATNASGGAPLYAENLAQLPPAQTHHRWASMASLTTSSSGASLIEFRHRWMKQVKKDAAAKKKAAEEAAAKEVAARLAAAREAAAKEAGEKTKEAAEDNIMMRAEDEAERLAMITRGRIARDARENGSAREGEKGKSKNTKKKENEKQ